MPRTGTNIYKRKDGRWEGRFIKSHSYDCKAKYGYIYGKTYAEVRAKLNETNNIGDHGQSEYENMTFGELSKKWLYCSKIRVKVSTLSTYTNILERHILPGIGGYKLKKLSNRILDEFANEKLSYGNVNGGGLSPKTVRDMLSLIKSIIEFAKTEKYITGTHISIKYPKYFPKEMRVLSRAEQVKLETVLKNDINIYKFGILVCLYMGLRIGEICALKWRNISLSNEVLSVRETIQRIKNINIYEQNYTKTIIISDTPKSRYSVRDIPIPSFLVEGFKTFSIENEKAFFLTGSDTKIVEPRTYQNYFKSYLKEGGIADANFHSLRHTFSTRCVEAGFDAKSLSEILGHSNVNITLNRYVHPSFEQKQKNMGKLCFITV